MKKCRKKSTNSIGSAVLCKVKLNHLPNYTTNATISPVIFKRECKEYDNGTLPFEHDLYLGERYG